MAEDLDLFFSDDLIAVDVSKGSTTGLRGIYSAPGELIGNDMVISEDHSVLMKTSAVSAWTTGNLVVVDGVNFYVKTVIPEGDGKLSRVTMSKQ